MFWHHASGEVNEACRRHGPVNSERVSGSGFMSLRGLSLGSTGIIQRGAVSRNIKSIYTSTIHLHVHISICECTYTYVM